MKRLIRIKQTLAAACLLSFAQFASAGIISFDPNPALGNVGGSIFVDMIWTGDGDYIGAFDVDVTYDAAIAEIIGVVIDPDFGLDSLGLGIYGDGVPAAGGGVYSLFGVSLDDAATAVANQDALGNTFSLATFEFQGVSDGETDVSLGFNLFGDEFGVSIRDMTLIDGQICVSDAGAPAACPVAAVPEPSTLPLALLALLPGILGLRRKRNA